jgi:predicted phage baseplate assembly protein
MTVLDPTLRDLTGCGCCAGTGATTPATVFNRPGLSAVAYRSGSWPEFKATLLAALAGTEHPALAGLTTRQDDDFVIALLDSVATVADVLTFYQERIANESYLRTATERRSILELARLIGYQLKAGAAASTHVAFTVDDAPGAPDRATLGVGVKVQSIPGQDEKAQTFETIETIEARLAWNTLRPRLTMPQTLGMSEVDVWLAGTDTGLRRGDRILLVGPEREQIVGDERWDLRRVMDLAIDFDNKRTHVVLAPPLGSTSPFSRPSASPKVYALRTRAAVFGASAPEWRAMSLDFKLNYTGVITGPLSDEQKAEWPGFTIFSPESAHDGEEATIDLDGLYAGVLPNSWLVLMLPTYVELYRVQASAEAARSGFAITAKTTRVTLSGENFDKFEHSVRSTAVFAQSEELPRAEAPITPAVTGIVSALSLDRTVPPLPAGRTVLFSGVDASTGQPTTETVTIDRVEQAAGVSRLVFTTALAHSYVLPSLTIYGNVAAATHGETVAEVLGGGDSSRPYQQFTLKQQPVTFVRDAAAASGVRSTLAIRVNDLLWHEASSFFGRGPDERIFVTSRDDAGRTVVKFGDGIHGARLPTGQENVRAVYRTGLGVAANLRAGQLSNLLTRPLGLKGAVNPDAAVGGDDAEPRDGARVNAPLTVLTLDRVVSLRDYEDFARAYAGIGKALATWSWDGERRGVFVTVAGPGGTVVAPDVVELLLGAIRHAGDPFVPLRVGSFRPARFRTTFKVKVDPDFPTPAVHAGIATALRGAFGFDARAFGQAVALSEVMATIQSVAGVVAVDVDTLARTDGAGGSGLVRPLPAALPQATSLSGTLAAELLTIADDPIVPGEMS